MLTMKHRVRQAIWVVAILIVADVSVAFAQTQVRVRRDKTSIWRREARLVAAVVNRGTVLEVKGREGEWYVVVIPPGSADAGALGLIAISQVEVVTGGSVPETPPPVRGRPAAGAQTRGTARATPHTEFVGFGHVGYGTWLARDTFRAVTGSSGAPMFGAGAQVRFGNGAFIEGTVERFEKTGQRVYVNDGQVFPLGIADTVRVIPIFASVGYRHTGRKATSYVPYAGVGAGTYLYKEASDFADPSENVNEHFTSYQVFAGVEFSTRSWVRPAVEVQFTTVPKALGDAGASAAFGEDNLGGVQVRLKILIGR